MRVFLCLSVLAMLLSACVRDLLVGDSESKNGGDAAADGSGPGGAGDTGVPTCPANLASGCGAVGGLCQTPCISGFCKCTAAGSWDCSGRSGSACGIIPPPGCRSLDACGCGPPYACADAGLARDGS